MKKLISWNVNGLRACVGKNFEETFSELNADFFCLQETKLQEGQLDLSFDGYFSYWNYAEKKGYSGTAIFAKEEPLSVAYGLGDAYYDSEGRVITLEYPEFYLVNCYTPNSQDGLKRLEYRMSWEDKLRAYLVALDKTKPVIYCGDLNVAHKEIDLKNPKTNVKNPGFCRKNAKSSQRFWKAALSTASAGFTRTLRGRIPGGLTASTPARTTRDGALTILSSRSAFVTSLWARPFTMKFTVPTIARWN